MWQRRTEAALRLVIVGAGVHGLATAYYLGSRHRIRNIALIDKGYLEMAAAAEHRHHPLELPHAEGILFYDASVKLYENLSQELEWNLLFSSAVT